MKNNALRILAVAAILCSPMRTSALPAPPKTGDWDAWSDWLETAMPDDDLEYDADSIGMVEKTLKQMQEVLAAMESGNAPELLLGGVRESCDLLAENLEELRKNPSGDDDGEESDKEDPWEGEPEIEGPLTGVPVVPLPALPRDFQNSLDLTVQLPPHEHGPDLVDDLRSRIDTYLEGGGVVTSVPIPGVDDSADNETNGGISVGGDSDDTVHVDEKNRGGGVPSGSGGGIVLSSVSPETASSSRESSPPTSSRIGRKSGTLPSSHGASAPSTWGAIRGEGTSKPMAGISPFGEDNVEDGVFGEGTDAISFDLLHWTFGGFKPSTNCVLSAVQLSDLKVGRDGLRFSYVQDLSEWGLSHEDYSEALACMFVLNNDGEWVGGKFDWISSSRTTRDFENIYDGYNGWSLRNVPNPCPVAFVIVSVNGKRRSNVISGIWNR